MKALIRIGFVTAIAMTAAFGFAGSAGAAAPRDFGFGGAAHVVFVQTDNTSGNEVVAYDRAVDGVLTPAGSYATGGLGGVLNGSVVDHLASQGSLVYDQGNALLYAVNAGSNTVSVFSVHGDRLALRQVVSSGGSFPVSVAVRGDLVYVLNAEGAGSVQGYLVAFDRLLPIPGSNRSLGLTPVTNSNQFTNTPGQVAFSPNGNQLIVTTKANGNDIDVFQVGPFGLLSPRPVENSEPGTVPFAITFDAAGHLIVADAGTNALSTFSLNADGTLNLIDSVGTGQVATCWVASGQGYLYASNAGSASLSGYQEGNNGELTLLVPPTATDAGTVDASADGPYLYVQTGGNGIVDEFKINDDGSLTEIGSTTVAGAVGGEGIVAF
jgi:6-phosphogluconolactonase (cycloisomerase 2 family)